MGMSKPDHVMSISTDVRARIEQSICPECEDECWHVEVWAHDLNGSGERACLLYLAHRRTRGHALGLLARWLMARSTNAQEQERAAWWLEHQPRMF